MSATALHTGRPPTRPGRLGAILFVLLLALAAAAALLLGRRPGRTATGGHDHAAPAPAVSPSRPVHLTADAARRIGVTFAPVTLGPLEREVRTVAQVTYDETRVSVVAPRVEGWIEQLHVAATGQAVRRGEPLFDLYSPMVLTAQQELLLARGLAGRLSADSGEASEGAAGLVDAARRRLRAWGVPAWQIEAVERTGTVSRTVTLLAPASGVVVEKSVLAGQRIMAGDAVYQIADLSQVWLEGEVFERDLPAARQGQPVKAEFAALPGVVRDGQISYVSPTLDPSTRTARVRVVLVNPGLRLKPGMYATLRFTAASAPALSVPRSAVMVTGERALAFVKRPDGAFEPRPLALGAATDDRLEVLRGLAVGDTVVASATFLVDAESNLGTSLGGMGDMPGMDIRAPDVDAPPSGPKKGR